MGIDESYFVIIAEVPNSNDVIMNYLEAILHRVPEEHSSSKNRLPVSWNQTSIVNSQRYNTETNFLSRLFGENIRQRRDNNEDNLLD